MQLFSSTLIQPGGVVDELAMAAKVVGFASVNPSLRSLISRRSDPHQQGGILGLGQSATSLARIFGPVCGLSIFPRNAAHPYLVSAGLMVAVRGGGDFPAAGAE